MLDKVRSDIEYEVTVRSELDILSLHDSIEDFNSPEEAVRALTL